MCVRVIFLLYRDCVHQSTIKIGTKHTTCKLLTDESCEIQFNSTSKTIFVYLYLTGKGCDFDVL